MVFASALIVTISGMALPQMASAVDDYRTAGAVRYLAARFQQARMEAVTRAADVAIQFVAAADGFTFRVYMDGNSNGVRTRDILRGTDAPLGAPERLTDHFPGVDFGVAAGLPAVDSSTAPPGGDPIHFGVSNLLSFSPAGTSSSGSVYIRGRGDIQYVIRVFGETGKTRILKYAPRTNEWRPL
jgi:hypothetical protein